LEQPQDAPSNFVAPLKKKKKGKKGKLPGQAKEGDQLLNMDDDRIDNIDGDKSSDDEIKLDEDQAQLGDLEEYGKADPHILKVYEMVCDWRVQDTTDYMESRYKAKAEAENSKSVLAKFGKLLRNVFIIGVVVWYAGPGIQETFENAISVQNDLQTTGE
jgi:hypothetical protein